MDLLHCGERSFASLLVDPSFCVGEREDRSGVVFCSPLSQGDASDDSTIIVLRRSRNGAWNAIQGGCTYFGGSSGFPSDLLSCDRREVGRDGHARSVGDELGGPAVWLFRRQLFRTAVRQSKADGLVDATLPGLATPFRASTELPRTWIRVHARLRLEETDLARNPESPHLEMIGGKTESVQLGVSRAIDFVGALSFSLCCYHSSQLAAVAVKSETAGPVLEVTQQDCFGNYTIPVLRFQRGRHTA